MVMVEWLTKATIWLVIACYAIVISRPRFHSLRRFAWMVGLVAFLAHVLLAFAVYYQWSWLVAWRATADDAERFTGVRAGWGLWLNFLFGLAWGFLTWRCLANSTSGDTDETHEIGDHRSDAPGWPHWLVVAAHGYLLFMVIMGGVVFAPTPARIFACVVLVCALVSLLVSIRRRRHGGNARARALSPPPPGP